MRAPHLLQSLRSLIVLVCLAGLARADGITSALSIIAKSGDTISYQITSTVGGESISYWVSNLPPGLSCTNSGLISGAINLSSSSTTPQTFTTALWVSNGEDENADGDLVWTITPIRQAVSTPSSSHATQQLGQPVTLVRNGSAYSGITWTETTVILPDGSTTTTSYTGLGSAPYLPTGGEGWYQYRLKVGDATGAAAAAQCSFYVGKIASWQISPLGILSALPRMLVGQAQSIYFNVAGPASPTATAVTVDPALDSATTTSAGPNGLYTAVVRALSRGTGSHWIYTTALNGNWWGDGLFMPVDRVAPSITFADRTYSASSGGAYTVTAADLNAAFANPFTSTLTVGAVSQAYYRLGYSLVPFGAGTVLPSGVHFVDLVYPGNDDYLPVVKRMTVSVEGMIAPRSLRAVLSGPTTVQLSWQGLSEGYSSYQVQRNGVTIGTTGGETFIDTGATAGAMTTYAVRAVSYSQVSLPATVVINDLEIHTPAP